MPEWTAARRKERQLSELRKQLAEIVSQKGLLELEQPVRLASGDWSRYFVDTKLALADGGDAAVAARSVIEIMSERGIGFDAIGGMTMGADVLAHGVAVLLGRGVAWFSVRKQAKDRGTRRRVEGGRLGPDSRVVLVDDVVTRGGSILDALEEIRSSGAVVVAAISVVDRGEFGAGAFEGEGIPYIPMLTYRDLGIPAVGTEPEAAPATG